MLKTGWHSLAEIAQDVTFDLCSRGHLLPFNDKVACLLAIPHWQAKWHAWQFRVCHSGGAARIARSGLDFCGTAKIGATVPLVNNVPHEERAVKFNRACWKSRRILEEAGLDGIDIERFDMPVLAVQFKAVEFAVDAGVRISQRALREEFGSRVKGVENRSRRNR